MHMLYVCVLCASCDSPQCCVMHAIYILLVYSPFSDRVGLPLHNTSMQFVNDCRGCKG